MLPLRRMYHITSGELVDNIAIRMMIGVDIRATRRDGFDIITSGLARHFVDITPTAAISAAVASGVMAIDAFMPRSSK